uniref:RPP4/RPP5-like protein n=1 Tax=Arabidopsis thaliana TaxID=3702 RepID=A0A346XQB6_ARATH|nr:RPP4/RPP5-like protein [Arabidopsis thaliana]
MASSSSSPSSRRYDVFPKLQWARCSQNVPQPSNRGARPQINQYFHGSHGSPGIERSCIIAIHKCHKDKDLDQMVIPVFYGVDTSEVRKQIGEFGDVFKKTCEDKPEDQKQRWVKALTDISKFSRGGSSERGFGDLVGIEDHIEAIKLKLCLESKEARIMVGIWGQSGIGQKDIKIEHFGVVEQRLKHKKVLILLDDVDNLEFLKTLVGKAEWFGSGSRIIVIIQIGKLLKAHEIDLYMRELAVEVVELAGNLPLGLSVLGSSLKGRDKDEWVKMMPRLRNDSDDKIEETLRVGYDSNVKELLEDDVGLTMLAEKSLLRITPDGHIEMHNLLEKLGREIDLAKSKGNPGKRQFLTNFEDIREVLTEKTGTVTLLGIRLPPKKFLTTRPSLIDEESFKGMRNLQFLDYYGDLPQSLVYLPLKLRLLKWYNCPLKSLPSTFKAEYLVKLIMKYSKLEKLWEGTLPLGSLKKMNLLGSNNLKEIPDLSNARNLEELDLEGCESLVTLPSSIQNAIKLRKLYCWGGLLIDLKSLEGMRNLEHLRVDWSSGEGTQGIVYFPRKLKKLWWENCPLKRLPSNFKAEYLVELTMVNSDLEKLWDGTQSLGSLKDMNLSWSKNLKEIPDLSLAINLEELDLQVCESLVTLPSSIQNATKLIYLDMSDCKKLESFPTDLNLESLAYLDLTGCPNLRNFPAIKMGCSDVNGVEDCFWNKNLPAGLDYLDCLMRCMPCEFRPEQLTFLNVSGYKLEKLWEGIQSLGSLEGMDLSESENLTEIPDLSKATKLESLILNNCKSLVTLPSTIGNLHRLVRLKMKECTGLEVLPTDVNLSSLETLDLSGCSSLRSFPLISTNIVWLYLENTAIEEIPSTIGNLHRLVRLEMKKCTGLEVLPTDVNLSSLETLDLSGCSSLRSFPLISTNIVWLYLENTAIEEIPCCIEDFTRLATLLMYCCQRLKNISPNIFRLTSLMFADFTDCRGVIKALSDATVVATMEDHVSCQRFWDALYDDAYPHHIPSTFLGCVKWFYRKYFSFRNCFKLDRDARELILRSCFKPVALPGGEIPKYFTHRAYGDSLTVTLPESSFSQEFLRFKACVVVEPLSKGNGYPSLTVNVGFNGKQYQIFEDADLQFCKTDHLFFCSFKFKSGLTFNDVEFKFCCSNRIKECGVRLMYVSQETEYNQQTTRSEKRMRMTSGTSEEYINLAGDQIVADTGLAALNLELSLGQGEPSSSTSLEWEALCVDDYMITEEQDEQIPILDPVYGN